MYESKPCWNLAGLIFMNALFLRNALQWSHPGVNGMLLEKYIGDFVQCMYRLCASLIHRCPFSWMLLKAQCWLQMVPWLTFEIWLRQLHSGLWIWTICKRRHLAYLGILESYASAVDQRARHNFREILAFKSSLPGCGQRPSTIPGGRPKQTVELFKPCIEAIVLRGAHEHKVVLAW